MAGMTEELTTWLLKTATGSEGKNPGRDVGHEPLKVIQ